MKTKLFPKWHEGDVLRAGTPMGLKSHPELAGFFEGLEKAMRKDIVKQVKEEGVIHGFNADQKES